MGYESSRFLWIVLSLTQLKYKISCFAKNNEMATPRRIIKITLRLIAGVYHKEIDIQVTTRR
jgi:hypothetical protein